MNKHIKRYITVMIVWSAILEGFAVYFGAYDILRVPLSLCAVLIAIIASGVMILKAVGSIIEERHYTNHFYSSIDNTQIQQGGNGNQQE